MSTFKLDKYEVAVGRFRQLVAAWTNGWLPAPGSGKHSYLNGGQGLVNRGLLAVPPEVVYETGWVSSDDAYIQPTNANLTCQESFNAWTDTPGSQKDLPLACVTWQEAYAFCIWDGGFCRPRRNGRTRLRCRASGFSTVAGAPIA